MKWATIGRRVLYVAVVAVLTFGGWQLFGPEPTTHHLSGQTKSVRPLQLTAIGDSLTHGVGDETNSGGYVALIKTDLERSGDYTVTTQNYGVTGDTSTQIQKRVDQQSKLRASVKTADILTVTVGGNDLMHVLQDHFLDITKQDVAEGNAAFQKRLATLIGTLRAMNPTAPIYVFGIYNPFYVYFPQLTAMTDSVTQWNAATKKTLAKVTDAYYVDIDAVLTKGGATQTDKATKSSLKKALAGGNPLIFTQDHFHPNNAGYAKMTSQLWAVMQSSQKAWEKP
ncbi:SGNH/GDSL hydrolase family protein [Lacticaseibacillus absianus]|uniref:SGNH/GDSL hydrolase family protein n=1 Tax=Lacticaseibacillus absianus TaxID=2729623 RepID=UPI0015CB6A1E|nr:SGNH/GDSL hydrolase family protein [Lacticaseibacillus absianus]